MKTTAIVLAAGSGRRMGTKVRKQYLDLNGQEMIRYSLQAFEDSNADDIILVCGEEDIRRNRSYSTEFAKLTDVVAGGRERYHSVYEGLKAAGGCDLVLIHDGARPLIEVKIINECIETLSEEEGCYVAVPSKDTVRITDPEGYTASTPDRDRAWIVQTPQAFRYETILKAYERLIHEEDSGSNSGLHITDDVMVAEHFGGIRTRCVMGSYENIKITTPEDLSFAETVLKGHGK